MQHHLIANFTDQELADRVFPAKGELTCLCREKDWSQTLLGPINSWSPCLRAIAALVVSSPQPMIVLWGPELVQIYNDGYREVMGKKHPSGLGQPTGQCWPEVWEFNAPIYKGVIDRCETFSFKDQCLVIERHGHSEEAFFTLGYSPAFDDQGAVGGVIVTVSETTTEVVREMAVATARESEERLRIALEAADLGTWDLDLTTDTAPVRSLRHDQIFGYEHQQAEWGQEIAMRHVLPEDHPTFQEAFARAAQSGFLSLQVRVRWPDGSIHWIASTGRTYYNSEAHPVRMAGVVADVTEQNQAGALRQSEERFRILADAVPQIVWITDANGRVEFFNQQWSRYTGLTYNPETSAEATSAVVHPDDVAVTMARFEQALSSGTEFLVEHRIRAASGDYRWFLVRAQPYHDPSSEHITRWFGASVDIQDRKLAEDTIRLQSARQSFQLMLADRIRPLLDPDDIAATASEMLSRQLDVSRVLYAEVNDVAGEFSIRRDFTQHGLPSIAGSVRRLDDFGPRVIVNLRAGHPMVIHDVSLDPDTAKHAQAYSRLGIAANLAIPLVKSGQLVLILSIQNAQPRYWLEADIQLAKDVAERTWDAVERAVAQRELKNTEEQARMAIDAADVGAWDVDVESGSMFWPARVKAMFGISADKPVTLSDFYDGVHPDDREHTLACFANTADPNLRTQYDVEYRTIGKEDQVTRWIAAKGRGIFNETDICVRITGTAIDITKRKASEEALRQSEERLRQSDRRKDEFLAMLAHELRNPLAPIGAAAQLLQIANFDEERVRKTSQVISRQVNHMTSLVDDLLDVSRVTRGLIDLDNAVLNIGAVVTDAIEQVAPLIQARHHRLDVQLAQEAPLVKGDKKRLVQVLVNLLNNAAKYTPEGGQLRLKTEVRNAHVFIQIIDNGCGMAPELVSRAFDLFAQAERTSDRSSGGLGLGLALVKSLVELHHGTVTCESAGFNEGTTFTVCLPHLLVEQPTDQLHEHETMLHIRSRSLRVLVVDDNVDAASMLGMLLEAAGHEVLIEHGPFRALERAQVEAPQVCLLDIGLPEMDGNELAERLRALPQTADALLIAVTGYGHDNDIGQSLAAGFDHHFVKPVNTSMLLEILASNSDA